MPLYRNNKRTGYGKRTNAMRSMRSRLRRRPMYRVPRTTADKIYTFKRSNQQVAAFNAGSGGTFSSVGLEIAGYNSLNILMTNATVTNAVQNSAFAGSSDFSGLFDQYRIKKVVIKVIPRVTAFDQNANASTFLTFPTIMSAVDYDDITPELAPAMQQRNDCKIQLLDKILTYSFKPRCQFTGIQSATSSATALAVGNPWIDINNGGAIYRGMKLFLLAYTAATADIYTDVYYEFKGSR